MDQSRRELLVGLTALTAAGLCSPGYGAEQQLSPGGAGARSQFPGLGGTYLDNASRHPLTLSAASAVQDYVSGLASARSADISASVRASFARLINADADEICYAPSTSMGENLVTRALDLPRRGGRIITDALHFIGSFYLYEQLGKQGMDVVILPMQEDGSVAVSQYQQAMTEDTVLIAVSHVSWINGFQHDLKALSDLAHAAGAYLYADIIQSAGNTPVDVKAMGVDFACCNTYKWLMGDVGLAFLYADSSLVDELVPPWYGYMQTRNFITPETHLYPLDPPGQPPYVSAPVAGVAGIFNGSFPPRMIEAAANASLELILDAGVEALHAYRQPMIQALQTTLRERGFRPYTPEASTSPIVSFIHADARSLNERLARANVAISTYPDRFRISPSFYNDMNDIDRVLEALGRA